MIGFFFRILKMTLKAALLGALMAVIIAYARLASMDGLKTALEAGFKQQTGRRLTVNGAIGLDLAFPPRLKAENVSLENPAWGSRKQMATIKKIEADMSLLPLIKGEAKASRVRLIGVDVLLETNKDGKNNWDDLANFTTNAGPRSAGPVTDIGATGILLGIGAVAVVGGTIAYLGAAGGKAISLPLPGANVLFGGGGGSSIIDPGC